MHSVGIDIIEIPRIERAIQRWGERFLQRVYTPAELELYRHRPPQLAVLFAAKEAVIKALGNPHPQFAWSLGIGAPKRWQEIEVLRDPGGRPQLRLLGQAQARAQELGDRKSTRLTSSHGYISYP